MFVVFGNEGQKPFGTLFWNVRKQKTNWPIFQNREQSNAVVMVSVPPRLEVGLSLLFQGGRERDSNSLFGSLFVLGFLHTTGLTQLGGRQLERAKGKSHNFLYTRTLKKKGKTRRIDPTTKLLAITSLASIWLGSKCTPTSTRNTLAS